MKIECGRDVPEQETLGESSGPVWRILLIWRCIAEGTWRGFLCGGAIGVIMGPLGMLLNGVQGAGVGCALGLIDGVALAIMDSRRTRMMESMGDFIHRASRVIPAITFAASLAICAAAFLIIDDHRWFGSIQSAIGWGLLIGAIPGSLAAFLAWERVQNLENWYFK